MSEKDKDSYFNGEWLRKASMWEQIMDTGAQCGVFLIWYQLNLQSLKPLNHDHVKQALEHLYRKVPNLGVCLGYREGERWLRRATNPDVDFQVLEGQTVDEVRDTLKSYKYNSETGPLFCGRLLINSSDDLSDPENLDPDFQHSCSMLFGFHHGAVDGTTNMYIMGFFIALLNDIIANRPINDEPLGTFIPENETVKVIMKKKALIESNANLKESLLQEQLQNKNLRPFITSVFSAPSNPCKKTISITKILNQETTSNFILKCRQEKVTVNSTFAALLNVALIDILVEKNVLRDSYRFLNLHLVNLRRYWDVKPKIALGCHIGGPLAINVDTPRNLTGHQFWDYVRSMHHVLKNHIESGKVLEDKAIALLSSDELPYSKEYLLSEKEYEGEFVTSNLGNVTSLVTEGGEHVKISHVFRSTTVHLIENPVVINFHSFRGRFSLIFDYNAAAVRKETAERFCDQTLKRLIQLLE